MSHTPINCHSNFLTVLDSVYWLPFFHLVHSRLRAKGRIDTNGSLGHSKDKQNPVFSVVTALKSSVLSAPVASIPHP